ncbi:hypothetical protein ACN5OK_001466 [Cronobacter malonaticus]
MSELNELIASEIADFFAGFGGPGEPDIQNGEAQRLLTERVLSVLALRERAEPQGNPVLAYADSYRDMARRGVESIPVWSVITDLERNISPLYTAPPASVVPDKCGCWYLVSWCYPGGRYGSTEIRLDGPWSTGSMRSAAKMIADYNDLVRENVVILSVFPIAAAPGKN